MSGLRDEIRAILREEIAALTKETHVMTPPPSRERVQIASSADLNRFAQDILARAADPDFAGRVARGEISFELAQHRPAGAPIVSGTPKPARDVLDKPLVTERDIAALTGGARSLRLGRNSAADPLGARRSAAPGHTDRKE